VSLAAHILQVIPRLDVGGAERTTLDISNAIVAAGGRSTVACDGGAMCEAVEAAGGEILRTPVAAKSPLTVWANRARLAAFIRAEGVDIVHARSRAPAWSGLWAARAAGARFITTYHGAYASGSPWKRFYNSVMTRGDAVIANSEFIRDHILREHPAARGRIVVIPRGVDVAAFDPDRVAPVRGDRLRAAWGLATDDSRFIVLAPGRLTEWKGQHVVVEAAHKLKETGQDAHFLFILAGGEQGRGSYGDRLRHMVNARQLGSMVKLVGHCADMPAAMKIADVVVSASIKPEAFGRVAAEGQAMGRPVLATDHGGARETVAPERTGWLTRPGDAEALAAGLIEARAVGASRRAAMGAAGRARIVERFAKDAMCAATLDVYRRLLNAGEAA